MKPSNRGPAANGEANKLLPEDRAAHEWYRFVLSFPPHLVRSYLVGFDLGPKAVVLDPFCGTGTTLVECKKQCVASVGIEGNPMAHFASCVKVDWSPNPEELWRHANEIADAVRERLAAEGHPDDAGPLFRETGRKRTPCLAPLRQLPEAQAALLLTDSISPLPLHKTLTLLDQIEARQDERLIRHERLALAKALVHSIGNLHFGPEVGVGPPKPDAPVVEAWLAEVSAMCGDLRELQAASCGSAIVHAADARRAASLLEPRSLDAVITSPPYPNEKDYTRTTRLESVVLGFLKDKSALRELKRGLLRSNTRGVYKADDDDQWVQDNAEVQRIAEEIEARRIALGKTSGFERMYARVTRLYFGGMQRHLAELKKVLRPGARLAYVVGDQASYLRVMIRTGELLAQIADEIGYEVIGIDLFRTRLATATREQLREEVVVLRWPGARKTKGRSRLKTKAGA